MTQLGRRNFRLVVKGEEGRMGEVKDSPGCGESSPQGEGETVSLETEMSYSASSHLL